MRGCKDCCRYLKVSGTEEQTSRHGFYKMQDQRYNNQVRDNQSVTSPLPFRYFTFVELLDYHES